MTLEQLPPGAVHDQPALVLAESVPLVFCTGIAERLDLVDAGQLTLRVAEQYPLAQIAQANRRAEADGLLGKIIITM